MASRLLDLWNRPPPLLFAGAPRRNRRRQSASRAGAITCVCWLRAARGSFRLTQWKLRRGVLGKNRGRDP